MIPNPQEEFLGQNVSASEGLKTQEPSNVVVVIPRHHH